MAEEYYVSKKYHEISVLMGETAKKIAGNGEEWMNYLDTAARLYRYPFEDQMLIYAQRPDAAACALMEFWNEKMHCWVNRGAKGIALFDRKSERPRLRYVFDVSDVHKARRIGKDPYLWEIREEHKDTVLAQLEKTYGATGKDNSFEGRLIEIAGRIAQDSYEELLQPLGYLKEGSFLEELDGQNIAVRTRETLSDSIAYALLSRCGADMEEWKEEFDFSFINEFNTMDTLSVIGNATADICKPLLIEIEKTVAAYDRQAARQRASEKAKEKTDGVHTDTVEKNPEENKSENLGKFSLANTPEPRYNALKRESDLMTRTDIPIYVTGEQTNKNIKMEGIAYGTDIREERGLPDTQPDTQQRAGGATGQVRADAEELSGEAYEGRLQRNADERDAESTLSGDTEAGRGEDGLPDRADGESRGSGRSTESVRSDEMGGEDEQHQALGGRNRTDGAGLQPVSSGTQLNSETEKPDNGEEHSLSGSFLQNLQSAQGSMELQKGILCSDEFLIHKRPEIAGYFAMEQDTRLQTEYFKNSFPFGTYYALDVAGTSVGFHANEEGLHINMSGKPGAENEVLLSWEDARFFVNSYMEDGVYLLPGEKAEQIDTDGMYKQLDLFPMFTEQVGGIAAKEAEQGIIPAEKQNPEPPKNVLPKEQLDTILRSGGGRDNSRKRIYAKYRQGKTPEEMAEFLKKEYRTTGKGFEFDGKQLSVWFNEQGMTAGYGTSALENPKFTMSWQEIEKEIRSQVESGAYMGANEAYLVDEVERDRIATYAAYFFYDGIGEMPEEIFEKVGNRSDAHAKMVELLSSPEGIDLVASHMDKALAQLESGEKKLRFRSVMPKEELRAELDNLLLEKKTFPLSDSVEVKKEDFITQDEIDHRLGRGSGYEHGSFRIYDYFMEGHDSKEAVAFLKNEYGTGGQTHALAGADHSYENHDGKGIKLEKGSIMEPYTKVLLAWNVVEKRIRKLIQEDKYLSPKGKEAFAEYKEEQAQKALERAQEKMERDTKVSCKDAIDRAIARNFDGYRLPKGTAEGVIKEYGIERVSYVLANTVMHRRQEERISPENKEWAKSIEPYAMYESRDIVASSHPAILNGFINQARRYIEREKELAAQAETVSQSEYKQEQPRQEEKEQPEQDGSVSGKLTDLEKKAVETAKSYESLPLTEKIGVIAQTFGCTSGKIETSPCTGKWRGTSDISLRLDNGASLFLGNYRTPQAKTAKVHNECVNAALVRFNPEIVAVTIEAAIGPLKEREAKDNEIALQKGLKPYTLLNVEISDGTDDNGGYFGWYYVTLAVDGKIHAHLETGLNHEISHGKISKKATRENYFTAGAVKESDVDYVFNNVGFSSTDGSYSLPIGNDVLERAKKELAAQAEAEQAQADIPDDYEGELDWHTVHDMDDDNGQPTEWAADLPGGGDSSGLTRRRRGMPYTIPTIQAQARFPFRKHWTGQRKTGKITPQTLRQLKWRLWRKPRLRWNRQKILQSRGLDFTPTSMPTAGREYATAL